MDQLIQLLSPRFGVTDQTVVLVGIGLGTLLLLVGVVTIVTERNHAAIRLAEGASRRQARRDRGLLRAETTPSGVMKSLLPTDARQRNALQTKLAQAGYPGPAALRNFTLVRVVLGLVLPGAMVALIFLSRVPGVTLPFGILEHIAAMPALRLTQVVVILVAAGYWMPSVWLRGRVTERRLRIEESFPNALDLMQISVEAGLGFDAAMTRVGNELTPVAPEIAFEFLSVQRQIQAGRARDAAMADMANRTGVEMVRSFASVVQQSTQFGTSMSEALTTYAQEMRLYREMKAQEMANKLPVKMSAVLASLMLPALILLTIGPVVIRYMRMF